MTTHTGRRTTGAILLDFLGSMNLAITLLSAVAIASVIGTILQQNEPYQNYILKFGPFWFEVYKSLGLFSVYGAGWFMVVMTFLVVSTSVCVYRNGPKMLRDMRAYRENATENSLRTFRHKAEWSFDLPPAAAREAITGHLQSHGYRARIKEQADHTVIATMKGAANRLGYLATHIGVVVVCVGALLDGNLPLKLAEQTGKVRIETREMPANEVPSISRLPADNASYRGLVSIPEGAKVNYIGLKLRDGYLLQELPFELQVKDFRVVHYPDGQPKAFESDLVIYDPEEPAPLEQTISVNHPWIYKGIAIYLASFSDGGSQLTLKVWPLMANDPAQELQGEVGKKLKLDSASGVQTLELGDFRLYNVQPAKPGSGKQFQDIGPKFIFKLRDAKGTALEYENYMLPQEYEDHQYLVSGVRDNPDDKFTYLRFPLDADGSLERFTHFRAALHDEQKVQAAVQQTVARQFADTPNPRMQQGLAALLDGLLTQFNAGGFDAVAAFIQQSVPQAQRAQAAQLYVELLHETLRALYAGVIASEGGNVDDAAHSRFFDDAVNVLGVLSAYGAPYVLQLTDFQHLQASGLQITRAPGKVVVYTGFGLLLMGVFIMFYLPQQRIWAVLRQEGNTTRVLVAGSSNRDPLGFAQRFQAVCGALEARLKSL